MSVSIALSPGGHLFIQPDDQPHDIAELVASRLLKPLGNPAPNDIKFFCTADVLKLLKDRSWLVKMTNTINQHWQKKNARQNGHSVNGSQNGLPQIVVASKTA